MSLASPCIQPPGWMRVRPGPLDSGPYQARTPGVQDQPPRSFLRHLWLRLSERAGRAVGDCRLWLAPSVRACERALTAPGPLRPRAPSRAPLSASAPPAAVSVRARARARSPGLDPSRCDEREDSAQGGMAVSTIVIIQ